MPCRARARLRSLLLQLGYCPWLLPRSRRRSSTATSQAPTRTTWFFSFVLFAFSLLGPLLHPYIRFVADCHRGDHCYVTPISRACWNEDHLHPIPNYEDQGGDCPVQ